MTLLLHGGKVAADTAKSGSAVRTAEGARNLLLHLGHSKIPFSKIVRKWQRKIIEQGQDLFGTRHECIEQILGGSLLRLAFVFRRDIHVGGFTTQDEKG